MRATAVILAVLAPALAVGAVDATAGSGSHQSSDSSGGSGAADDMNVIRLAMNAARAQTLLRNADRDALIAATPPSPAQIARATRSLERKALASKTYVRPVPGPVTQWYGSHPGIDIAPPYGTPIGAAHSGVVTFVGWDDGYGMHVEVAQLDGFVTTYSHMSAFTVKVGQLVLAGQQLGNIGSTGDSTGPHLHFEVHLPDGQRTDPAIWLFQHGVNP
ncbi:MAG TPA: M23 family metallopeptidase [Frankiaceae bacterium]|jgi:murein DD-endopeptidase MepM/ murein hydrolase activator NlpD|nr:M23 family metallopeptidase [Frankiaceae bacterium]